jgi:hypothetical protein
MYAPDQNYEYATSRFWILDYQDVLTCLPEIESVVNVSGAFVIGVQLSATPAVPD